MLNIITAKIIAKMAACEVTKLENSVRTLSTEALTDMILDKQIEAIGIVKAAMRVTT